jgi:hypothetical protein
MKYIIDDPKQDDPGPRVRSLQANRDDLSTSFALHQISHREPVTFFY